MRLAYLATAAAVAFFVSALAVPAPPPVVLAPPVCPQIAGHRAGGDFAPENTLAGITATATQGAAVVELDVRFTASHFPVLMHDATVDRTTPGTGAVAGLGMTYVTGLSATDYPPWKTDPRFAGQRVPYAYDFLSAAKRRP